MIKRSKMVLIEYLEDAEANAGLPGEDDKAFTIEAGTQRWVDAGSANSLVNKKGIAKFVVEEDDTAAVEDDLDDVDTDETVTVTTEETPAEATTKDKPSARAGRFDPKKPTSGSTAGSDAAASFIDGVTAPADTEPSANGAS